VDVIAYDCFAAGSAADSAVLVYSDPENLTAYLPNKRTNGWEVQPASLVLPPMAQKNVNTLFDRQPYEDAN
jgi:hypothetical protein